MKLVVICLCAAALAAGCADGSGVPTSPSASAADGRGVSTSPGASAAAGNVVPLLSASPRSGDLRVIKECSGYTGGAGSFCTITSSNVQAIEVGSKILYLQPDQLLTPSGSDVILDPPGPGNNKAFGHCSLALGVCTFSGGTGKFTWFQASVGVSPNDDFSFWFWNGTYSFSPPD